MNRQEAQELYEHVTALDDGWWYLWAMYGVFNGWERHHFQMWWDSHPEVKMAYEDYKDEV